MKYTESQPLKHRAVVSLFSAAVEGAIVWKRLDRELNWNFLKNCLDSGSLGRGEVAGEGPSVQEQQEGLFLHHTARRKEHSRIAGR